MRLAHGTLLLALFGRALSTPDGQARVPQPDRAAVGAVGRRADLAGLPGNRLESLKGDRAGQYSIRINDQWRICFAWPERSPGPINVEIVDYH
jgi:proteic killer suppression protein